jgi:transcriptional regulator with XRE-family HTH domain
MRGHIDNELRARVRGERKRRGWTQEETAQRAGVVLRTYQGFESGKSWPQPANLVAILAALEIDEDANPADEAPGWSGDVAVFLDVIGAYLEQLGDAERLHFMRDETRRIFAQMRRSSVLTTAEESDARTAIHAAMADEDEHQPARSRKISRS